MRLTRRHLQIALGVLWLLDGALQLQPFMFTTGFSNDVLASAGEGQPQWISGPVTYFAEHIAQHPALFNAGFAIVQLALGIGFLLRRTVRPAILASILWSLGVWWFGEGLGGLASGHATLITGAPGAVVLYAVLAAAVWPEHRPSANRGDGRIRVAGWLPWAWAAVWVGGAVLQLLPGQHRVSDVAGEIAGVSDGAPRWLAAAGHASADVLRHLGAPGVAMLVMLMAAVGLGAIVPGGVRNAATAAGAALAALFWLVGQNLGELYSGRSTDPNTGPLLILFAVAIASCAPATGHRPSARARRHLTSTHPETMSASAQPPPRHSGTVAVNPSTSRRTAHDQANQPPHPAGRGCNLRVPARGRVQQLDEQEPRHEHSVGSGIDERAR